MRPNTIHPNDCGNCKHWHEWPKEKQMEKIRCGDCDKICKGDIFEWTDRHGRNHITPYAGWSFEDENYNDDFRCFEPAEE